MYRSMTQLTTSETNRTMNRTVLHDEKILGGKSHRSVSTSFSFQLILDTFLSHERRCWRGGVWIGQTIHCADDGFVSFYEYVSGMAS